MLYEVLSQPKIFLWMCIGGMFCGLLFDLKNVCAQVLNVTNQKTKFAKILFQILSFFASILAFFVFYIINLKTNYGQFRIFTVMAFALAFCIERFLSINFIAKPVQKCYNTLKEKHKRKLDEKKQSLAEPTTKPTNK